MRNSMFKGGTHSFTSALGRLRPHYTSRVHRYLPMVFEPKMSDKKSRHFFIRELVTRSNPFAHYCVTNYVEKRYRVAPLAKLTLQLEQQLK